MTCINRVIIAGGPHLIPFRTQSLSLSAPMVLCLKARESRSSPGLYKSLKFPPYHQIQNTPPQGGVFVFGYSVFRALLTGRRPWSSTCLFTQAQRSAEWKAVKNLIQWIKFRPGTRFEFPPYRKQKRPALSGAFLFLSAVFQFLIIWRPTLPCPIVGPLKNRSSESILGPE